MECGRFKEVSTNLELAIDGLKNERKKQVALIYVSKAIPESRSRLEFISSNDYSIVEMHEGILFS